MESGWNLPRSHESKTCVYAILIGFEGHVWVIFKSHDCKEIYDCWEIDSCALWSVFLHIAFHFKCSFTVLQPRHLTRLGFVSGSLLSVLVPRNIRYVTFGVDESCSLVRNVDPPLTWPLDDWVNKDFHGDPDAEAEDDSGVATVLLWLRFSGSSINR